MSFADRHEPDDGVYGVTRLNPANIFSNLIAWSYVLKNLRSQDANSPSKIHPEGY
ncbi:MAG TPA: hypothetical protein V6C84_30415 [Coleofasciculaceae cyanobacterium]